MTRSFDNCWLDFFFRDYHVLVFFSVEMVDKKLLDTVETWLSWDRNENSNNFVRALLESKDYDTLQALFSGRLEFGTAGLRARMGPGPMQLNDLVIIQTTQGLAEALKTLLPDEYLKGVVIGFDKRHNSETFAKRAASVLISAGIPVSLFRQYVATPYVAFATRKYEHAAGIMITASHNPKEDNGYKLYWSNGAQIISPIDKSLQDCIQKNLEPWEGVWDLGTILSNGEKSGILNDPFDKTSEDYLKSLELLNYNVPNTDSVKFAYTAMHGVGHKYVVAAFDRMGFNEITPVEEQCEPDPEFPTVRYPNPEEGKSALDLSMKTADKNACGVILANDPDADRLAVAEKLPSGNWKVFSGNELGTLIGWWIVEQARKTSEIGQNLTLSNCFLISSTVSSRILETIAGMEGLNFRETLTGFKWMGNLADSLLKENKTCLFAFEEAIGYMCGSNVLDKDGISAAIVVAQLSNHLYAKGSSLAKQLSEIYAKYGFHVSYNSYFFCKDVEKISQIFNRIRSFDPEAKDKMNAYPKALNGIPLVSFRDLTTGIDSSRPDGVPTLPVSASSQMITFYLTNGITVTIRTSGTEPKVKFYSEFVDKTKSFSSAEDALTFLKMHMKNIVRFLLEPEKNGLQPAAS